MHFRVNRRFVVIIIFYSWVKDMGLQVTEVIVSMMFGRALMYVTPPWDPTHSVEVEVNIVSFPQYRQYGLSEFLHIPSPAIITPLLALPQCGRTCDFPLIDIFMDDSG